MIIIMTMIITIIIMIKIINNNNKLYYSVKFSSKATLASLIGVRSTTPALAYSYRQVCGFF